MAENDQQVHPMPPPTSYPPQTKHDEESATAAATAAVQSEELRRQKRKKLIIYIAVFVVFQIAVITAFSLTVMKVKTPKFRVRSATFDSFDVQNSTGRFNLMMDTQLGLKNPNFGPYKYGYSSVSFYYKGTLVGSAVVSRSKAKMLSTKKFNAKVPMTGASISGLADDLNSGILPLTSQAKLQGKVTLMLVMKKKKSSQMDCTMEVNINTRQLQNIKCK